MLQLEDYDWVTAGDTGASRDGVAAAVARLDYPAAAQHYLSGFVLRPDQAGDWARIEAAAAAARARGVAATFLWALPQVMRDGLVHFDTAAAVVVNGSQVVGSRQPVIAAPTGGSTIDNEARAVLAAVLSALRTHGLIAA